jgi:glucose-1-phosphate adenylyltransferase
VLAGGTGTRLCALTDARAKPAVPFGGHYRTVDFTLSNCVNSGIRRIALLTQYKSQSLIRHAQRGWGFLRSELGELLEVWPAQQRQGERWYIGTVDAVHQNQDLIGALNPEYVLVLAGDHVYSMDYSLMLDQHAADGADLTVGCVHVPASECQAYGVVELDERRRLHTFVEKPDRPQPSQGQRATVLASMGIYVFSRDYLFECLNEDANDPDSVHDFGYSILPRSIGRGRVHGYVFRDGKRSAPGYWRDVGTVDTYWAAHMDLLCDPPKLDLYDSSWPIWTHEMPAAPAQVGGTANISASILGRGCRVSGDLTRSVVSAGCVVGAHSRIESSVLLPNVRIGERCSLNRVIVDSDCTIPDDTVIGASVLDDDSDHYVSPRGVVLVSSAQIAGEESSSAKRKVA